jgi:hypothetical protein
MIRASQLLAHFRKRTAAERHAAASVQAAQWEDAAARSARLRAAEAEAEREKERRTSAGDAIRRKR